MIVTSSVAPNAKLTPCDCFFIESGATLYSPRVEVAPTSNVPRYTLFRLRCESRYASWTLPCPSVRDAVTPIGASPVGRSAVQTHSS